MRAFLIAMIFLVGALSPPSHATRCPPPPKPPCSTPVIPKIPPVVVPKLPPLIPTIPPVVLPKLPPVTPKIPPIVGPKLPPFTPTIPPVVLPKLPPVTPKIPPIVGPKLPPFTPTIPPLVPPKLTCPIAAPKISGCINLFGGLVNIVIGKGTLDCCCPLLTGLDPLTASHCLCNAVKGVYPDPASFVPHFKGLLGGCGLQPPAVFPCH